MEILSGSVFVWLFLILGATEFKDVNAQCSDGWSRHRGRCFKFFADAKTWGRAMKACLGADANLASVHSYHEQKFIQRLIHSATYGAPETWIGGFDAPLAGKWLWSDGKPVNYTFWAHGKPEGELENCVLTNFGGDLRWDNAYCMKILPFVCARPLFEMARRSKTLSVLSGDLGPAENRTHLIPDSEPQSADQLRIPPNMTESDFTYSRRELTDNTVWYRSGRCPSGWKEYGYGTCFKFFNIMVPWAEAENRCKNAEAHLASVHSHDEYEFMRRLIWETTYENTVTWIGGTDTADVSPDSEKDWMNRRKEGHWTWTDGSYNCYHNWAKGQPNGGTKQNCMEMNFGSQWQWNDRECGYTNPFMCRKEN